MKKIFDEKLIDELSRIEVDLPSDDWAQLAAKLSATNAATKPVKNRSIRWYAVAASVAMALAVGGVGLYYLLGNEEKPLVAQAETAEPDIKSIELSQEQQQQLKETLRETFVNEFNESKQYIHDNNDINVERVNTKSSSKERSFADKPEVESIASIDQENTAPQQADAKKETVRTQKTTEESLDDYADRLRKGKGQGEPQTPTQKKSGKEQRQELRQRMGFQKPLYAKASASIVPVGVNSSRLMHGGQLHSTNPNIPLAPNSPEYTRSKHSMPMILGVGVGIPIIERWLEINTGVQYTYLHSTTDTYAVGTDVLKRKSIQGLHYIGVPINIASNFFEHKRFRLYASAGIAVDKGILNRTRTIYIAEDSRELEYFSIKGVQLSANGNIGASMNIVSGLTLYVEPRITWYIPSEKHIQPKSKITDTPLQFNLVGGIRWNFAKKSEINLFNTEKKYIFAR